MMKEQRQKYYAINIRHDIEKHVLTPRVSRIDTPPRNKFASRINLV